MKTAKAFALILTLLIAAGCGKDKGPEIREIKSWALNSLDGVVVKHGVEIDSKVSRDGKGSLKITTPGATTVSLFTAGPLDVDKAKLIYQAMVKTEDVQGDVYLEMWCVFKDKGEFFSRALESPLKGTSDWTMQATPFMLEDDQKPEIVRLNIVITGPGVVWIDDVKLLSEKQ
jgi:hypothetical protein